MWKYYALLSALFAALTAIFAKIGVKGVNGNIATAVRTSVVLIIAWGIVFVGGQLKEVKEISKSSLLFLLISGIATGLSWIFYFKALETGPVSKVVPIDKLSMVLVILLSFLILKEPMDAKMLLGGACILIGTLIIVL